MSTPLVSSVVHPVLVRLAETEGGEEHVNHLLSYGIGALVLGILLALMAGLLVFGGGREHT